MVRSGKSYRWAYALIFLLGGAGFADISAGAGRPPADREALDQLLAGAPPPAANFSPNPTAPAASARRLVLGVNYTGAQCRWRFNSRWGAEARWQHGTASSDYGDVAADVYGLRGYRYLRQYRSATLYLGSEVAYTRADADSASYSVSGPVAGAFGGVEIRVARHVALGIDIGPYVLSLKEKQTGITDTQLDFVLNTGVLWYLF